MPLADPIFIQCRKVGAQGGSRQRTLALSANGALSMTLAEGDGLQATLVLDSSLITHSQIGSLAWEGAGHTPGTPGQTSTALAGWNGETPVTIDPASVGGGGGGGVTLHNALGNLAWATSVHTPAGTLVQTSTAIAGWDGQTPVTIDPASIGGGGGVTLHSALGNLAWAASLHTPDATTSLVDFNLAGWDSSGTRATIDGRTVGGHRPASGRKQARWVADNGLIYGAGVQNPTRTGSTSWHSDSDGSWTLLQTQTSGTFSARYIGNSSKWTTLQNNGAIEIRFKTGAETTKIRHWILLASSPGSGQFLNGDTGSGHYAGVRYSSYAGDSGWKVVTRDNSQQTVVHHSAFAVNTVYKIRIELNVAGSVEVTINDVSVSSTGTLPLSTQSLGVMFCVDTQQSSPRREMLFSELMMESD